jgi:tRNA A37 N6-isopentenylltransferase MiaA
MPDPDLAADRALVAECARLHAEGRPPCSTGGCGTLAERLAVRLDEVEELRREVVRLREG